MCLEKNKRKILNALYISYYVLAISYYILYISYYVLHEYSLVLVMNKMSKKLKSVMKKLFRGKSGAGMVDIVFPVHIVGYSIQAYCLILPFLKTSQLVNTWTNNNGQGSNPNNQAGS
jgi:hypothetical protein